MDEQIFSIEYQYQKYLEMVRIKEADMMPVQRVQLRETFFGACGVLLMLLEDKVSKLPTEKAFDTCLNMKKEVLHYFKNRLEGELLYNQNLNHGKSC